MKNQEGYGLGIDGDGFAITRDGWDGITREGWDD